MEKTLWKQVVESDFAVPEGYTTVGLLPDLLGFLGSTDVEVRDPFGYTILTQWIVRDGHYSPDELRAMRDQLIGNLKVGIGETETDSVFLRSFSVLMLSVIAYRENQVDFLTQAEINALLNETLSYFAVEQDLRGFVPDKGWAHSCAHTADVLKFLARNPKLGMNDLQRILDAIADKLLLPVTYVYVHGEDERLVSALMSIVKRDLLDLSAWTQWLERFAAWKRSWEPGDFIPTIHAPWLNIKTFLRSLYFRLGWEPDLPDSANDLKLKVLDILKEYGQ